jgi:hypothetical protein
MLPGLFDDQRRDVARLAAMLTFGAAATLPLTAQPSLVAGAANAASALADAPLPSPPAKLTFPVLTVERDPFVPDPVAVNQGVVRMAADAPATAVHAPILRAVIVGDPTRALVDVNGDIRVVGVGDRIGDLVIDRVTSEAVVLSDGSQLELEGSRP